MNFPDNFKWLVLVAKTLVYEAMIYLKPPWKNDKNG